MKKRIMSLLLVLALALGLAPCALAAKDGVRVAVIDTGVSTAAVSADSIADGKNYIISGDGTEDRLGHGTAVSAIIVGSEAARITGICPTAEIVPLVTTSKNKDGLQVRGDTAIVAQAVYDAVDVYDCKIINISSGATGWSLRLKEAVEYAEKKGVLVVSSAGNGQETNPGAVYYPGGYESVLCVGAANADGSIAAFSQQNDAVDLLALGTDLRLASVRGTRIRGEGTSFATAIVTGAAAKLWTRYPELTAEQVRRVLLESSRTVDGWKVFELEAALAWSPNEKETVFSDVADGAYYYDAVLWAAENDITGGTGGGKFSPDAVCSRAQMVTFLWRAAGSPEPNAKQCPFADVDMDSYYGKAVLWAVEKGITGGTGADTFSPDMKCTRGQMAAFLCRMAGGKPSGGSAAFSDVAKGAYYADAVQWAAENGISEGTGNNRFSPDAACTRGQIVTFLYRCFAK